MNTPIYLPPTPGAVAPQAAAPAAVMYARLYAGALALLYVIVVGLGALMLLANPGATTKRGLPIAVEGWLFVVLGVVLAIPCFVAVGGGRQKWRWTLSVVLMGLGCTSCMCLPLALPLLIAWIKPEVKAWYGA